VFLGPGNPQHSACRWLVLFLNRETGVPHEVRTTLSNDGIGHRPSWIRHLIAACLRGGSSLLAQIASRVEGKAARRSDAEPRLEFYAEAGAQEGALYVDGRLVGRLPRITRL
jgi:hypothetical protein